MEGFQGSCPLSKCISSNDSKRAVIAERTASFSSGDKGPGATADATLPIAALATALVIAAREAPVNPGEAKETSDGVMMRVDRLCKGLLLDGS